MTIDEVIQIEKYYGKKDKKALEELQNEFPMIDGIMDNNLHEQIAEWLEEFKALKEKATPKKLEIEKFWGYDDLMCPNCKSYKIRNPKYCCDCGQKLDWE